MHFGSSLLYLIALFLLSQQCIAAIFISSVIIIFAARNTLPSTCMWIYIDIFFCSLMAILTMKKALIPWDIMASFLSVAHVIQGRTNVKMVRIAASRIIATVADKMWVSKIHPKPEISNETMDRNLFAPIFDPAIFSSRRAIPVPAPSYMVDGDARNDVGFPFHGLIVSYAFWK